MLTAILVVVEDSVRPLLIAEEAEPQRGKALAQDMLPQQGTALPGTGLCTPHLIPGHGQPGVLRCLCTSCFLHLIFSLEIPY